MRYYEYNLLLENCEWAVAGALLTDKELARAVRVNRGRSGHFVKAKVKRDRVIYLFGGRVLTEDSFIQVPAPAEGRSLVFADLGRAASYIKERNSKEVIYCI